MGAGGGGFSRGLGPIYIVSKYTPTMRSRIWSTLILATLCVILRSRVLTLYVGACYTRGAGSRRPCAVWGRGTWYTLPGIIFFTKGHYYK